MSCLSPQPPTEERLDAFLRGRLDGAARSRLETHLSQCDACRRRLVQAHRLGQPLDAEGEAPVELPEELEQRVKAMGRRSGRRQSVRWAAWARAGAALATAALLLIVLGRLRLSAPTVYSFQATDPTTLRAEEVPSAWQDLQPADGSRLSGNEIELAWTLTTTPRRLTVTVLDGLGNIRLRTTVDGGRMKLTSEDLSPPPQGRTQLYWYLTAQLMDGTALESEISGFSWQP